MLGGVLWVALVTGHTFVHGSTQSPRDAAVLGLTSLDFFRLLGVPPLLLAAGLALDIIAVLVALGRRRRASRGTSSPACAWRGSVRGPGS